MSTRATRLALRPESRALRIYTPFERVCQVSPEEHSRSRRPRIGTDNTTISWRWDSDPFGTGVADTDPDNDTTDHVVSPRFLEQYEDEESGHYLNY